MGTLAEESNDKDTLNWLYKDEEEIRFFALEVVVPIEPYGNGFIIMQRMRYKGKGHIVKG